MHLAAGVRRATRLPLLPGYHPLPCYHPYLATTPCLPYLATAPYLATPHSPRFYPTTTTTPQVREALSAHLLKLSFLLLELLLEGDATAPLLLQIDLGAPRLAWVGLGLTLASTLTLTLTPTLALTPYP